MHHLCLPPLAWFPWSGSPWPVLRTEHEPCEQPLSALDSGRTPSARAICRKRQLSKIQAARLFGLPGISLAQRLAQFQHDLTRQIWKGQRAAVGIGVFRQQLSDFPDESVSWGDGTVGKRFGAGGSDTRGGPRFGLNGPRGRKTPSLNRRDPTLVAPHGHALSLLNASAVQAVD
jgi:hypothetical protein